MANPIIKIKRSAVAGRIPTTTSLELGELAINTYDGKIYIEQDQGGVGVGTTIVVVNPWSVGTGTNTYNTYFTTGNVGIAVTIPTSKLHISGDALVTGIVTSTTLSATNLQTTSLNSTGITTLTNATGTNLNFSGIGTITTLNTTNLVPTNINVSGISTLANATGTNLNFTGVSTLTNARGTNLNFTGVGTITNLKSTDIVIAGLATFNSNVSIAGSVGIGTIIDIIPYDTLNSGTLSFEGSAGQLFSITNNLTSGSIFSVNDVSGIPSIDVNADGTIVLAPYADGNVGIATTRPTSRLHVFGDGNFTGVVTASSFSGNLSSTNINATNLNVTGITTLTNATGNNVNFSGVGTITTLNTTNLVPTRINSSGVSTLTTLLTTNLQPTNLNASGISTLTNATGTNLNFTGVSTLTNATGTNANFSGVTTATTLNSTTATLTNASGTNINYSGIGTITTLNTTNLVPTNINSSGISTLTTLLTTNLQPTNINATGISTLTNATGTNLNFSGVGTIGTLNATTGSFTNITGTTLSVSGLSTFTNGPVLVGSGTSTGTASQRLQVTGGAYVSGSVGIGVTNPQDELHLAASSNVGIRLQDTAPGGGSYATINYNDNGSGTNALDISADAGNTGTNTEIRFTIDGSEVSRYTVGGQLLVGTSVTTGTSSQRLQVTGGAYVSGNLGIGTTNPTENLSVLGKIQINQLADSSSRLIFRAKPGNLFRWNIDNDSSEVFRIFREDDATAANGVVAVSISTTGTLTATKFSGDGSLLTNLPISSQWSTTSTGIHTLSNVGIGTTNPTSKLTISGDALISGIASANTFRARGGAPGGLGVNNNGYGFFGSGDNDSGMYSSADGQIEFYSNSAEAARITSNANLVIGTTSETGTSSQKLQVTGGTYVSGNAGIGSTNPSSKLSVIGDGYFSGIVTATTFSGQINSGVGTITTLSTTNLVPTNINSSGVSTLTTLNSTTATLTNATGTNLNFTGVSTLTNARGTNLNFSGVSTISTLYVTSGEIDNFYTDVGIATIIRGTNLNYSGVGTIATLYGTNIEYDNLYVDIGISTVIRGTNLNYSGIGTITTLNSTTGNITTINATTGNIITGVITNAQGTNLNYSGIATLGTVSSGNINSSGIVTASAFVGSGASLTSLNASNISSGTVPGSAVVSAAGSFTVGTNLFVNGTLSVGGTSIILNAQQLQIADRDIVLGVTTDANNNDVSTDNTSNHGGIAVASTTGTPLINIPLQSGINSNPSTYKQFMWIKQGNYTGLNTDSWVSNYPISIGNTSSVQSGSRLTVGTGFTVYENYVDLQSLRNVNINSSGVGTITTLNSTVATLTNASGTNINYSGVGTIATFNATSSSVTNRTGTNLNITGVGTIPTLSSTVATLTNAGGTNLNFTGVSTLTNASGTNLNFSGVSTATTLNSTVATLTNVSGTNINYSGLGTITTLNSTNLTPTNINSSGISTLTTLLTTNLQPTNINASGITTLTNATGTNLNFTGVSTLTNATGTNANFSGVTTATTLNTTNLVPTNISASGVSTLTNARGTNLNFSGVGTIATLYVTSGEIDNFYTDVGIATVIRGTNLNYSGIGTITTLNTTNLVPTNINSSGVSSLTTLNSTVATLTNASGTNLNFSGIASANQFSGYKVLVGTASSTTQTFTITVAPKTTNHRYYGTGSSDAYFIDGIESPFITLLPGKTYRFNQDDISNSGHPFRFYLESNKTTQYSTNVTTNGTPGSASAYTEIVITDTTPIVLHYQCSAHAYMGNAVSVNSNFVDTPYQITARSGINATGVVTATSFSGSLSGNVTGNLIGNVNSSGVSTFTNLLVGTGVTINSGIVSATTFSGNLSGNATGLSGTPNISVGSITSGNINSSGIVTASSVIVGTAVTIRSTGINATGVITATSFVGSGSLLTGIVTSLTAGSGISINQSTGNVTITATGGGGGGFFVQNSAGIHTLSNVGVGTTNPTVSVTSSNTAILAAGIVTAYKFYGDGSNLTGIVAASGIATVAISTTPPSSPSAGDMWYNSNLGRTFIYYNDGDSSQWVDSAPFNIPQASTLTPGRTDTNFTATAGQTTFTVSYTVGYIDVYLNGVRLTGTEYVANNGTSVILAEGAAAGDIISVVELRTGIGATGPAGAQATASLTIATRAGVFTQNAVGAGITIALRSGVGTASF